MTLLLLGLSARSVALAPAQRSRAALTAGPLVVAAGLLLCLRTGGRR